MTRYDWLILAFAAFVLPTSYWLAGRNRRRAKLLLAARIALLLSLLGYPWDFFAIQLGAWRHPTFDGWRIYGVPLNDSIFTWLFSYLACVAILRFDRRVSHRDTEAQSEGANDQHTIDQRA
jgi:lycopene cyclase domain-containing protein